MSAGGDARSLYVARSQSLSGARDGSRALTHAGAGARFDLFPDPEIRQTASYKVSSAYVVDKKTNQFWVCTVRYNFTSSEANNGDCVVLPPLVGLPSLGESYLMRPVSGNATISQSLPIIWFIEPATGDVQFCALRHPGVCVQLSLPE
jgi:hypothetical protein